MYHTFSSYNTYKIINREKPWQSLNYNITCQFDNPCYPVNFCGEVCVRIEDLHPHSLCYVTPAHTHGHLNSDQVTNGQNKANY